jgi:hypothetical protein
MSFRGHRVFLVSGILRRLCWFGDFHKKLNCLETQVICLERLKKCPVNSRKCPEIEEKCLVNPKTCPEAPQQEKYLLPGLSALATYQND